MKRTLWMVCAALVALVSCEKQPEELNWVPVTFDLQATQSSEAGTKSVKSSWENGDLIFVVFSGLQSPNYLKLTFDQGVWVETQMTSKYEQALPLNEGDKGTMTAIFLPFTSKDNYIYDGTVLHVQ